ncbi:MAG: hypothetical protein HDQ87_06380 [Clostridia bacterium]|nr:hypothetical protein [Clostridia bacterium]
MKNTKQRVYVLDREGKPLMPTTRFGKVRRMLRSGKAKAVRTKPFTIQLQYEPETHIKQRVVLGIDPGRTNIGVCAVREDGISLFAAHVKTRNKDVPEKMKGRKVHRQVSRRGERLARKRLAKKHGTRTDKWNPRSLPGCEEPVSVKDIRNTESRFIDRKRPDGWLTPTATQLLRTHMNVVALVSKILPVAEVAIELNRFAFMKLDDPAIEGVAYQKGPMRGFGSVREAIETIQGERCLLCGKPIEHLHHIVPRSQNGMNTLENLAGLCRKCHERVHKDADVQRAIGGLKKGTKKKHAGASVLNQIMPRLLQNLESQYSLTVTEGWQTKAFRDAHGIGKTHHADAYCIACSALSAQAVFDAPAEPYSVKQYRRHDRARIQAQTNRVYKLDGKAVAWNRHKAMAQDDDSLAEWHEKNVQKYGRRKANSMRSRLLFTKSRRRYNNLNRNLPGSIFLHDGKRRVLRGQQSGGKKYTFEDKRPDEKQANAKDCTLVTPNTGLVFL